MRIDDPAVLHEVEAVFAGYEAALVGNDVATLDALFSRDFRTIHYGCGEPPYNHAAITAFRAAPPAYGLLRGLERTVITTFGTAAATCAADRRGFSRDDEAEPDRAHR